MRFAVWLSCRLPRPCRPGARRRQRRPHARPGHRRLAQRRRCGVQAGEGGLRRRVHLAPGDRGDPGRHRRRDRRRLCRVRLQLRGAHRARLERDPRRRRRRRRSPTSWRPRRARSGAAPRSAPASTAACSCWRKAASRRQRRVIDVCGDGTNNAGRDVTEARDDAVQRRHHHQRAGDHQRPSGVVDLCPCPAAGRTAELLSGKCHWRPRQLRAGGARLPHLRRGDDAQAGHRDRRPGCAPRPGRGTVTRAPAARGVAWPVSGKTGDHHGRADRRRLA